MKLVAKIFLGLAWLAPTLALAQGPSSAQIEAAKGLVKLYTTAGLPATCPPGKRVWDTTADEAKVCLNDGVTWQSMGGGGGGDITAVGDCNTGACFNGTQGTTFTFNNAGGDATLDYDGTDFSFSKLIVAPGGTFTGGTTTLGTVAGAVDAGGATSFEIPNAAAPTTDAFGEIAGDNDAWAASRGAVQFYDGTANTYLVGALASDTPSNGQVPTWNTGGTVTWETPSSSSGVTLLCKGAPAVATTGTAEEVLATCSMSAGLLTTGGHAIRVTFFGHTAANANIKVYSVRVGGIAGTVVYTSGSMAANDSNIATTNPIVVTYLSATTATAAGEVGRQAVAGTAWTTIGKSERSASITWANALDVVITATTATASGDATLDTYQVELLK